MLGFSDLLSRVQVSSELLPRLELRKNIMLILNANTELLKKVPPGNVGVFDYLIKMDFFDILAPSKQKLCFIQDNVTSLMSFS